MIQIYNTLTRKKEKFVPLEEGKVKMYVCGPTVYNYIHLGNARPIIFFDTVKRYLVYKGYKVIYAQNFTDVDDKIIKKANETGLTANQISETYIKEFLADAEALNVIKADLYPKVTENMDEILDFIQTLVNKKIAYSVDGNVFFATEKFNHYGKLSKQSLDDLLAGARIEVDESKKNPLDFALWKKAKEKEVFWQSPWGEGRPGWHIECSAMVNKYLGETIDIHGGGADLIFPHHENEIAQSESITGQPFARYWMHNGLINFNYEKMSKSLGTVFTIKKLLSLYDPLILRFLILSIHYRTPINFSEDLITQAIKSLERIKASYLNLIYRLETAKPGEEKNNEIIETVEKYRKQFEEEMNDDFNTANAISVIFELIRDTNKYLQEKEVYGKTITLITDTLKNWFNILGMESLLEEHNNTKENDIWIEKLIEERNTAKTNKDWKRADEIRNKLSEEGMILEDTPQGVRWRKK